MSPPWINGYLIVSPREAGAVYQGPDRSPWEEIDEGFYQGSLPKPVRVAYDFLRLDQARGLWWPTCTDLGTATMLAAYSRKAGKSVEVIAIHSPYLAHSRSLGGWFEPRARLLGFAVVAVGEWSLLKALLEARDPACRKAVSAVNEAGLLPDASCVRIIEARYREFAGLNLVEPIADPDSGVPVEAVEVYVVDDDLVR